MTRQVGSRSGLHRPAAGIVIVLVAVSCGTSNVERAAPGKRTIRVTTLARETKAAGSARIEIRSESAGPSWTGPTTMVAQGGIDFDTRRMSLTIDVRDADGDPRTGEYRVIGDVSYSRGESGDPEQTPTPGRPWIRTSDAGSGANWFGGADVGGFLDAADHVGARVRTIGTAEVRGTATTHYRVTFTERIPAKLRARGHRSILGTTDVWADAHDRIRRTESEQSFPAEQDRVRTVTELFDFGTPVTVEAPPANQVTRAGHGIGRPVGDWSLVGEGSAGDLAWAVYRIRLAGNGACVTYVTGDVGPPRGMSNARSCWEEVDDTEPVDLSLQVLPNGSQLVFGLASPRARTVTLHYDDGHTEEVTPRRGGLAFSVTGNQLVTELAPRLPGESWTCRLDTTRSFTFYNCSGSTGSTGPTGSTGSTDGAEPPGTTPPNTFPEGAGQ